MRGLRLQVKVVSQASHNPKGRNNAPIAEFLHLATPNLTLEELTNLIGDKYAKLYPRNRPLNIQRLQDSEGNDLDLTYTVGDVFDDKSSNREGSIVKVIHKDVLRDESVPPESGLRPASSKKRPIQSLSTVTEQDDFNAEEEDDAEEEIGVPVNLHRSKRQRVRSSQSSHDESLDRHGGAITVEGDAIIEHVVPASSNAAEPSRSRQSTLSSDVYVAEPSVGRTDLRSPSLGAGPPSVVTNHRNLSSNNHLVVPGTQERGSSLIPETSQGLGELLSPKEESFSSPLLFATSHRTVSSNIQPVEISPEVDDLDVPVIAPQTLKGSAAEKTATPKSTAGSLKRPARAAKKPSPRGTRSVYDIVASEEESEDEMVPAPRKGRAPQPPKKLQGPTSKRTPARKAAATSATPVVEVPSSQSSTTAGRQASSDFVVEVPHIDEVVNSERRGSASSVQNVADLIGSKYKPDEDPVQAPTSQTKKGTKVSPPAKRQAPAAKRGSKQPETPAVKDTTTAISKQTPSASTKRTAIKTRSGAKATTPQAATTPEASDKNDGKGAASTILHSALRNPERRSVEAKKTVSFANEGSPTPVTKVHVLPAGTNAKNATAATTKASQELKKPRTTFKVPVPVIPVEQQGIGDRSTVEARKAFDAFVGKASSRSMSSTPPVGAAKDKPSTSINTVRERSGSAETGSIIKVAKAGAKIEPAPKSRAQKTAPSPVVESSEDEDMEDAPPLPTKPKPKTSKASKSKSPSTTPESSESESDKEEDSDEEEAEDEEEKAVTPQKKDTIIVNSKPMKRLAPESSESSSSSSSEAESDQEVADLKGAFALSDSDEDQNEEGMTREESPVKAPGKRQLRSASPEKKDHVRISYGDRKGRTIEPVPEALVGPDKPSSEGEEDYEMEEVDADDEASKAGTSNPTRKAVPKPTAAQEVEASESENEAKSSKDKEDEDEEETGGEELPTVAAPQSSISVVPESPRNNRKETPQPAGETDDEDANTTTTNTSTSKADSDSDEDSSDDSDQEKAPPTSAVKAMNALFRRGTPASPVPNKILPNGNTRNTPSRPSKTPEPSQPPSAKPVAASPSKLPPSRMNRRTLGYISPSPGPPSSMPARLPSMLPSKDTKKRHSLSTHYKGLSTLSQQDIPETRDAGKSYIGAGKPLAAAAVITSGGPKPKPRMSESMKSFQNMLSSQKGGKDSDEDDSDSDSDDSAGSEAEEVEKDKPKSGGGLKSLFGFL
ncbi:hypothetical protein H072_4366 [Dactylellina haptotyla CBS 200.50]|uniref:Nucleolar protein Dnt1-like N-terminal domain-containing protein n=1 Tax=Dactylellina haptotyla (strain CBS 200.50) TaxID=1284197 RepID=S8BQJ3_DACHA|nr:hypothetical protein H072_4366 [Dactylellina haptotyla CBS 200.50]